MSEKKKRKISQTAFLLQCYDRYLKKIYKENGTVATSELRLHYKKVIWGFIEIFLKRRGYVIIKEKRND